MISRAVLTADKEAEFSHVGIVAKIGETTIVVHAEPESQENLRGVVQAEHISLFTAHGKAGAVGLYRVAATQRSQRVKASEAALRYAEQELPFDNKFSLDTEDALYCTELVWRAYLGVGLDLADGEYDTLSIPFASGTYLLPSRILASRHIEEVRPN